MFISLVGFGFLGGITGVVMGAEQINVLVHNTLYVPGHFHATVVGVSLFLMGAGTLGVPRRHWDIGFAGTGGITHEFPAAAYTMLALNGMSVILAVIGGASFCLIIVGSLLWGKKLGEEKMEKPCIVAPVTEEEYSANGGSAFAIPGTVVLALTFFVSFALYYFINWKYLAETWGIG
jgi:cytochrome c oxidase subunit 1